MKIKIQTARTLLLIGIFLIVYMYMQPSPDRNRGQITLLNYGIAQIGLFKRRTESQKLADHIYKRILYWQEVHKIWQEQEEKEYENQKNKI